MANVVICPERNFILIFFLRNIVNMSVAKILWVDDEIESLTSQIMFLENKGYEVAVKTNGFDAVEYVKDNIVDVVLLDETMPGITGLQTLQQIKELNNTMPVVLITKNEAENLMDEAIGSQISDYLIKPVNPNQVWLSLKNLLIIKGWLQKKLQRPTSRSSGTCLWRSTITPITTSGWTYTKNSCTGNWK